jgi:hypothetical protein
MWEKKKRKDQTITQNVTEWEEIWEKISTSPELSTSNNWGWAETLKNSFTLVELIPLHKNRLSSLSVTRVTTHSKRWVTTHSKQEVSDNTLEKKVSTTAQETNYKKITKDQVGRIERS